MNWERRKADLLSTLKTQAEVLQQTMATFEGLRWRHIEEERLCDELKLKDCVLRYDLIRMEMARKRRETRKDMFACINACWRDGNRGEIEKITVNSHESLQDFEAICQCHRSCVHSAITSITQVNKDMQDAGIQVARSHLSTHSRSPVSSYF